MVLTVSVGGGLLINSSNEVVSYTIPPSYFVEVTCIGENNINNKAFWDISFLSSVAVAPKVNNVEIYGGQLKIPPHENSGSSGHGDFTNHSDTRYDTQDWIVISKTSYSSSFVSNSVNASRMILVFEYKGDPFDLDNLYPILTSGNNSSYPDAFQVSFMMLENVGGKTRLKVSVTRVDLFSTDSGNNSNWMGTFLINLLLAKKK